jgi:hypothetical protein
VSRLSRDAPPAAVRGAFTGLISFSLTLTLVACVSADTHGSADDGSTGAASSDDGSTSSPPDSDASLSASDASTSTSSSSDASTSDATTSSPSTSDASTSEGSTGEPIDPPSGSNADRLDTALEGHDVPFEVCFPADPITTSRAMVTPATIFDNLVAGRALTLQAGDYGGVGIDVDDVELIAEPGVTFTSLTISGDRFRITGGGGTAVNGPINVAAGTADVMLDNVAMNASGMYDSFALSGGIRCLALANSTLSSSSNWVLIGGDGSEDIVFANSEFVYTGAMYSPMRTVGVTRLVVAGSRFFSDAQGQRVHNTSTGGAFPTSFVYLAGNQFESTGAPPSAMTFIDPNNGGGDGAALTMSNVWVQDNRYYRAAATEFVAIGSNTPGNIDTITVTGNVGYGAATPGTSMSGISGAMVDATNADNMNQAYEAPPVFTGGAG